MRACLTVIFILNALSLCARLFNLGAAIYPRVVTIPSEVDALAAAWTIALLFWMALVLWR